MKDIKSPEEILRLNEDLWTQLSPQLEASVINVMLAYHSQFVEQAEGWREALEDLLEAIPKQTNDADWWEDDLTNAVEKARKLLEEGPKGEEKKK